jgi:hypothetical protein
MAIDVQELVEIHIKPVLEIDGTLRGDLPAVIASQIALQGWVQADLTDKQAVYCAAITLEALLPRIALIYTDEVQKHRAGPQQVELPDRATFFKALQKAIDNMKTTAGRGLGTVATEAQLKQTAWPGVGVVSW